MWLLANLKAGQKIYFVLVLVSAVAIGVGLLGLKGNENSNHSLKMVYETRVVPLKQLKMVADMYAVNIVDTCHKVRNGSLSWNEGLHNITEAEMVIEQQWREYIATKLDTQEEQIVKEAEPLLLRADNSVVKVKELMKSQDKAALNEYTSTEMYPSIDPISQKIADLVDLQLEAVKQEYDRAQQAYNERRAIALSILVGGIGLALGIAFFEVQLRMRNADKTEQTIHRAEITALQAQIQPHFLYNTLNTIRAFCRTNPQQAAELLDELSNYLQGKFRFNSIDMIPLDSELELIKSYLAIEKVRFDERLQIIFDIESNINPLIPPLILQPLVENAVKHGVYPKRGGGTIQISVKKNGTITEVVIADDGIGMAAERREALLNGQTQNSGIGIANINARLKKHYGCGIEIHSEINQGTIITVHIPEKKGARN